MAIYDVCRSGKYAAERMATSTAKDLPVLGPAFSSDVGAFHAHEAEDEAQHAQTEGPHQQAADCLDVAFHRPEHGEVVAVADGRGVCEAGPPQAGPVPGHLDDGGAAHASDATYLPAFHGHGAGHKDPA